MRATQRRTFRILPVREELEEESRAHHMKLVPRGCVACGELTTRELCTDCEDRARPHDIDDPYDIVGGEDGPE